MSVTALFLAPGLLHAVDLRQPFDGAFGDWSADSAALGRWAGDGSVTNMAETSVSPLAGKPIADAGDSSSLAFDGEVVCTNSAHSASRFAQTEMLFMLPGAADGLPPESDVCDVQFALACGTNYVGGTHVPVYAYCRPKGGDSAEWVDVALMQTGVWARVTMLADYGSGMCKVCIDGLPAVSRHGYLTTNASHQAEVDGAWYMLPNSGASDPASGRVTELRFTGDALADDVVISQTDDLRFGSGCKADVTIVGEEGAQRRSADVSVSRELLAKWGVGQSTIALARLDETGLSVSQKLEAGLDPLDGQCLQQTGLARAADGEEVTVSFNGASPCEWHRFLLSDANAPSASYVIKYDLDDPSDSEGGRSWYCFPSDGERTAASVSFTELSGGVRSATFALPEALRHLSGGSLKLDVQVVAGDVIEAGT